jgi:type II secretory pathway pseudopilin PulG
MKLYKPQGNFCIENRGFTLIEIMLIVAALAIIAGLTIIAINPLKQLSDARNRNRQIDVGTIWSAMHQYALDNHGELPASIRPGTLAECTEETLSDYFTICKTDECSVTLSELLEDSRYLVDLPTDPSLDDENYTGYNVVKDSEHNYRVTVCAPLAENEELIYLPQ